jgi:hypothetical protein
VADLRAREQPIAEVCGMDPAQARQEARWQTDRERAWRAFIANVRRILEAPLGARAALLTQYRAEAASCYGAAAATQMHATMRRWIEAQERKDRREQG